MMRSGRQCPANSTRWSAISSLKNEKLPIWVPILLFFPLCLMVAVTSFGIQTGCGVKHHQRPLPLFVRIVLHWRSALHDR